MGDQRKATLFALGAVLMWSTVATAFKLALRHLDHFQLLFLANVFSIISLAVVLAAHYYPSIMRSVSSGGSLPANVRVQEQP